MTNYVKTKAAESSGLDAAHDVLAEAVRDSLAPEPATSSTRIPVVDTTIAVTAPAAAAAEFDGLILVLVSTRHQTLNLQLAVVF